MMPTTRTTDLTFIALVAVTAALLSAAALQAGQRGRADKRPNILILLSDDQRADSIAAYGNPHIRTPNLDRLVAEGFSFRHAYCMGSMHGAVCQPSRAMLNTGRPFFRVPMDLKGETLLPEHLQEAGYVTFGTGKWHNGMPSFRRGFNQATAVFFGGMSDHRQVPVVDLLDDGTFGRKRLGAKFSSELFADAVIAFLERHPADVPFYAYVAFTAPHDPRTPPSEFLDAYRSNPPPLPANFMPQHPFDNEWLTVRDEQLAAWPRTPQVLGDQLAEYYGMISHLDAQVGRVLDALAAGGHADDTIVIFASDHGLAIGSHGLLGKQNLYEHSMRTPLIVAGPGIPRGGSSDALVYLHDLFPTVCTLTGVSIPEGVEAQDLAPIWRGETEGVRDTLFTAFADVQRAIRDERWKLIRYPHINFTQLFDLKNDPDELENLAARAEQGARVESMIARLGRWQREVGDNLPLTSEHPKTAEIDLTGHPRTPDQHQPPEVVRKYFTTQ